MIDEEVRRFVDEAYSDAKRLIDENWEKVVAVAEALLKYETLGADEVGKLLRGEPLTKPTISDLLAAEARKEAQVNAPKPTSTPGPEMPPGAMPRPA
jgi:cell division protease FtsH